MKANGASHPAGEVGIGEAQIDVEQEREDIHRQQHQQGRCDETPTQERRGPLGSSAAHGVILHQRSSYCAADWLKICSCSAASAVSACCGGVLPSSASPSRCVAEAISSLYAGTFQKSCTMSIDSAKAEL